MCDIYGVQRRGETPGVVVEAGCSGELAVGRGIRNFGSGKGVAATGIRPAWRERGRVGGGDHGQIRIGEIKGT